MIEYFFSWLFASVFGYIIPWWFWVTAGFVLAVVAFLLLPFGVDGSFRMFIAQCVMAVGVSLGALSWGVSYGIGIENARWEGLQNDEVERLKREFAGQLLHETNRANIATANANNLKEELSALDKEADAESDASGVVISEPIARRLHSLSARADRGNSR